MQLNYDHCDIKAVFTALVWLQKYTNFSDIPLHLQIFQLTSHLIHKHICVSIKCTSSHYTNITMLTNVL